MKNNDFNEIGHELLIYSLQPRRFSFFVKLARKILWRVVRPFHFYQIQKFHQLVQQKSLIMDNQGHTIDRQGHMIDNQGQVIDRHGHIIDNQGHTIDRQGHMINNQGQVIDRHGHIIDNQGQVIDCHRHMIDNQGQLIDRQGHMIDTQGKLIDHVGQLVLEQKKILQQLDEKICQIQAFSQSNQQKDEILNSSQFDEKMKAFFSDMKFELIPLINRIAYLEVENHLLESKIEKMTNFINQFAMESIKPIEDNKC